MPYTSPYQLIYLLPRNRRYGSIGLVYQRQS